MVAQGRGRPVQGGFDGPKGATARRGDLLQTHLPEMPQDEDLPLTRRQRVDRLQKPAAKLATLLALRGGLVGRGQGGAGPTGPSVPVVVQGILRHSAPVP